jgi:dTDP-4-dehydrorhamnose reductase
VSDANHLVFGATGMLGRHIVRELRARGRVVAGASRRGPDFEVDLRDAGQVRSLIARLAPGTVWNAAALVNLGACEKDPGMAYEINARAVAVLAEACRTAGARLVQVSTDHYFQGDGGALHDERAPVRLLNEYARTKFAGEAFALAYEHSLVLRTNITGFRGAPDEPTFAEWAFDVVERDLPATLFTDMCTSTLDCGCFARAACDLVEGGARGLVNLAAREAATKKDFVHAVASRMGLKLSQARDGSAASLCPPRGDSLGLDVNRAESLLGYQLPDLAAVVRSLVAEYGEMMK